MLACAACAGSQTGPSANAITLAPPCPGAQQMGAQGSCRRIGTGVSSLVKAENALANFRVEQALPLLVAAQKAGPHARNTHARIYEQLGIAHAYLGHRQQATNAFRSLLYVKPNHLLSYTLSPKVTFLFENARKKLTRPPAVAVNWPRGLSVDTTIPVDIEVVSDPRGLLTHATLHVRSRGQKDYRVVAVALPKAERYKRVLLPARRLQRPDTLQLYLRAYDKAGNEILHWAKPDSPREIALSYSPPQPWYRKWWIWTVAGSMVAAGTGLVVYGLTREPPDNIPGSFGGR